MPANLLSSKKSRLSNAVEIKIILPNKLIHLSVFITPEFTPQRTRKTTLVVPCDSKRKRSPKTFRPHPNRKTIDAFLFGAQTPQPALPEIRKGTSVLPVLKRIPSFVSTSRAASRASIVSNSISKLCLPFSAPRYTWTPRLSAILR